MKNLDFIKTLKKSNKTILTCIKNASQGNFEQTLFL